jgi:hypothetical protein
VRPNIDLPGNLGNIIIRFTTNEQSSITSKIFVSSCYLHPKIKISLYVEILNRVSTGNKFTIYSDISEIIIFYNIGIKLCLKQ